MQDVPVPDEVRQAATAALNKDVDADFQHEEAKPTAEGIQKLLLESLAGVSTLTELSDLFSILSVKQYFQDALTFLTIDYTDLAQKLSTMARNVRAGNQDPPHAASEVPDFLRETVMHATKTELAQLNDEKIAIGMRKYRFEELGKILNGEDASEDELRSALNLLSKLGEYRGAQLNEKPYTMQELSVAALKVIDFAEKANDAVLYNQVSQMFQKELPVLEGMALDFFARAIETHAGLYKRGRVTSLIN